MAGIFTVLSPCVLPVLPVIFSAGMGHGKWNPLGVVLGLVGSFSFFTLALTAIVTSFVISADLLRTVAIWIIISFGIIMIFPKLSDWFARLTTPLADLGQRMEPKHSHGFWGGVVLGIALGLVWTPCAGPILATITTLVAAHAISPLAIGMVLSYSVGAGLLLLLISHGSRKIVKSSRFLLRHAEEMRRIFGVLMILFAVALIFHWDIFVEQKLIRYLPRSLQSSSGFEEEFQTIGKPAPEFVGIAEWINSPPLTIEELRGNVVIVEFWTYGCIHCLKTIPYLKKWNLQYGDLGLTIVGVHTPEFEAQTDLASVQKAVKELGIDYAVAVDNKRQTWDAYHNQVWPSLYLLDKKGIIRGAHFGDSDFAEIENQIESLLNP